MVVDHSFFLQVDELEGRVGPDAFVLLDLRPLADSFVDCNLQLQYSFEADCVFEETEAVDEQVHEELLPLQGDAGIYILRELQELVVSEGLAVLGPVAQSILNVPLRLLCLLAQTPHVGVLVAS